jgi:branched-chain amino acid aminotransferase
MDMNDAPRPDFSSGAAFIHGRFVPIGQAHISVLDWGFTRSDCVYDVVHVFNGAFFRLSDHLDRFARSMHARRLALHHDRATIERILHRCVALSGLTDAYVAYGCQPRASAGGRLPPSGRL